MTKEMTMISDRQAANWLNDHCVQVTGGLRWPDGTEHPWGRSTEIVRLHLGLGLEPQADVTNLRILRALARRLEGLEQSEKHIPERIGTVPPGRCADCHHTAHDGRRCLTEVPTAEGRECWCITGMRPAEALAEIIKAGIGSIRVARGEDMNLLQTWLEGGPEESDAAAIELDRRAVDNGILSPAAYRVVRGELPPITAAGHRWWCGLRDHAYPECGRWGDL